MAKVKVYDAAGRGLGMTIDGGLSDSKSKFISESYLGQDYYLLKYEILGDPMYDTVEIVVYEGMYDSYATNLEYFNDGDGVIKVSDLFLSASEIATGGLEYVLSDGDRIIGNSHRDRILGFSGDDFLYGAKGNDALFGMSGDDKLFGGGGSDLLKGQAGWDTLKGNGGNDRLFGGGGSDKLKGGTGSDLLKGQAGGDQLNGGGGDDVLQGGAGEDLIVGGRGDDALYGGRSSDWFVFGKQDGQDTIYDFEEGRDYLFFHGASGFSDLDLSDNGSNAVVRFGQTAVVIEGAEVRDLIEGDAFLF